MGNEYFEYETIQGDTFDMIALDFYNDEYKASEIIKANQEYKSTIIFPAGVTLKIPVLDSDSSDKLPPWRQ